MMLKKNKKKVHKLKFTWKQIVSVCFLMCIIIVGIYKLQSSNNVSVNIQNKDILQEPFNGKIKFSLEPVPDTTFKGEVRSLRARFKNYYSCYGLEYSSVQGVQYDYDCSSIEEAFTYLGYADILHPYHNEKAVKVSVSGTKDGNFNAIYIQSQCKIDTYNVKMLKLIPTDYSCELGGTDSCNGKMDYFFHQVSILAGKDISGKSVVMLHGGDDLEYDMESYTSNSKTNVQMLSVRDHDNDNVAIEAYFSIGNIIYVVGVEVEESQIASGSEMIKEVVQQYIANESMIK